MHRCHRRRCPRLRSSFALNIPTPIRSLSIIAQTILALDIVFFFGQPRTSLLGQVMNGA